MPSWVAPPARARPTSRSLAKSLLRDAHPPLYYVVMLAWVKAFGIHRVSIRLPSVLLGAASVLAPLAHRAPRGGPRGRRSSPRALLALHGQQVYWSQTARVYALAIFLGLLSTFLLWKALEDGRRRWRVAYALSAIAALWTQSTAGRSCSCQIVWSSLRAVRTKTRARRCCDAVRRRDRVDAGRSRSRSTSTGRTSRPIRRSSTSSSGISSGPARSFPGRGAVLGGGSSTPSTLALGVVAAALGLLARPRPALLPRPGGARRAVPRPREARCSLLGGRRHRRDRAGGHAGVPARDAAVREAARWSPPFHSSSPPSFPFSTRWILQRRGARARFRSRGSPRGPCASRPILAFVPFLCMVAGSLTEPAFLARGTMLYVPFLLLVVATGLTAAGRMMRGLPLVDARRASSFSHVLSIVYARASDHTLRDYRELAKALEPRLSSDDLILITNEYSDPPLLFYMRDRYAQFVPSDWANAVASRRNGRVWIIRYEDQQVTPGLAAAVASLKPGEVVTAPGSRACEFGDRRSATSR